MNLRIILVLLALVSSLPAFASDHRTTHASSSAMKQGATGIGIMLGAPTGITLKHFTSKTNAFDLGLAYSFGNYFTLIGDYLWHFPKLFKSGPDGERFVPYLGIGAAVFFDSQSGSSGSRRSYIFYNSSNYSSMALALRIPIGMEFFPSNPPLGIFLELAPGIGVIPATFGAFQGAVGVRYYF